MSGYLRICAIFFVSAIFLSSSAFAAKDSAPGKSSKREKNRESLFEILKVEGTVYYWRPLGNQWHVMRPGVFLRTGTIIQIQEGGNIDYRFYRKDLDKWFGDQAYLRFKSAVTFRLDADILRTSNVTEQLLETPPQVNPSDKNRDKKDLAYDALGYAWNRLVAYINPTPENKDYVSDLLAVPNQEVELGFRAKKIKLLKPEHGAAVFAFQIPTKIKLIWQRKDEITGPYGIHLWQAGEPRPPPSFEVDGDQYDLLIAKPGSYFVQISAMNGRYLSSPHTVHVGNPIEDEGTVEDWLTAGYPLQNMILMSEHKRHNVDVNWHVNDLADFSYMKLHLKTLDGKAAYKEFHLNKHMNHYELNLSAGSYIWWVEAEVLLQIPGQPPKARVLKTEPRQFRIVQKNNQKNQLGNLLSKAMQEKKGQRIYLESGL